MAIHTFILPNELDKYTTSSYNSTDDGSQKYSSSSNNEYFYRQKIEKYEKESEQLRNEIKEMKKELLDKMSQSNVKK